ncbi:MAG: RtcB family protein [Bacteroidota bacterium]
MEIKGIKLDKIHDYLWEIPKTGRMQVPGRIYISQQMLLSGLDEALTQVVNVAHLPGIQKYSLAMPDIHWGYGFPIGGVAATDPDDGVISPGGVGYDINCGVRLAKTALTYDEVHPRLERLVNALFSNIPTGVGASGAIKKVTAGTLAEIMREGSAWAVKNGFGESEDLMFTEEHGALRDADPAAVSPRAVERGLDQAGTLGSGNHFLEVDVVSEIFDPQKAAEFGLFKDQIVVLIHTGSRGFGYQVCDDYLKILLKLENKYGFQLPDRQLACAPVRSEEGQNYMRAMRAAANFAWNNRQIIMHLARKSFMEALDISATSLEFRLLYDVCHNIAKMEEHVVDGKRKSLCVHRKGATRAFAPDDQQLPLAFRHTGQPVLIPGDMGRYSYVLAGTQKAMQETFGSSCHGAGRSFSRHQAMRNASGRDIADELYRKGIVIRAKGKKTLAEEMPEAYKDVSDVVDVMHNAGITDKVAKLKPVGVIKG